MNKIAGKIRVRFPPSPTGDLHIGGVRTALYNYIYAKQHGGKFILRIEDTDLGRNKTSAVQGILDGLKWVGLNWDEGPFFQSDNFSAHREAAQKLLASGHAYNCYCSETEVDAMREGEKAAGRKPRYIGRCRDLKGPPPGKETVPPAIRLRLPEHRKIQVPDLILRDKEPFNTDEMDDFIILRSSGVPIYHLSVVVDDINSEISHVIRGDDHFPNTPKQMLIYEGLGVPLPQYAHLPMINGPDGKKMSKRHGAASVLAFRDLGYLPEAMINCLARLGWGHATQETFSMDQLIETFRIENVSSAAPKFDLSKLESFNKHWMAQATPEKLWTEVQDLLAKRENTPPLRFLPMPAPLRIVTMLQKRSKTLVEMADQMVPFFLATESLPYKAEAVQKHLTAAARPILQNLLDQLVPLDPWSLERIKQVLTGVAENQQVKLGAVAQPLRVAITGTDVSPPIDEVIELLGKETSLARLRLGISKIA